MNMSSFPVKACKFWPLVCKLYEQEGVEELCLHLQEEYDCDVNLLLILTALEALGMSPTDESLAELREQTLEWQEEILKPMRKSRYEMKASFTSKSLLDVVKELEVIIEKAEHESLFGSLTLVPATPGKPGGLITYIEQQAGRRMPRAGIAPLLEATGVVSFA